jgi:hypothetical protein
MGGIAYANGKTVRSWLRLRRLQAVTVKHCHAVRGIAVKRGVAQVIAG